VQELDDPDLREDAALIRDQADRCRDILRSMGRAGKDDKHMQRAPIDTVIREAAEPHVGRGKQIEFHVAPMGDGDARQPVIMRQPEIVHGLRNLVQNAVDFAQSRVWVEASWTSQVILIRISDDGAGFPPGLIGRLGDPLLRRRRSEGERAKRPEYEGMGLGLFIAKTLLERSGARLSFRNGSDPFLTDQEVAERSGAIVEVIWPRSRISPAADAEEGGLGLNEPIRV
jgi:two-component system sensor histidine kinase RegB